jgi:hypothetical protein
MDPEVTLSELYGALLAGDQERAHEYLSYLQDWADKGGFPPDETRMGLMFMSLFPNLSFQAKLALFRVVLSDRETVTVV